MMPIQSDLCGFSVHMCNKVPAHQRRDFVLRHCKNSTAEMDLVCLQRCLLRDCQYFVLPEVRQSVEDTEQ